MRLGDYLDPKLVIHGLQASGTRDALERIGAALGGAGLGVDVETVVEALAAREETHTTVLGGGVAVPHATVPGLDGIHLVVATAPEGVPFGPPDTEPVTLFFTLLSSPGREREHIKLLARICRLVRHPAFTEAVRSASDPEGVYRAILDHDSQHV